MASEALGVAGAFDSVESAIAFARASGVREVPTAFGVWAGARDGVEEAAGFVASLGKEEATLAAQGLVSAWARTDAYAASEWVAGLSKGLARDAAAEALARSILREEPSSAVAWALTLDDPVKREPLLKDAFRQWLEYSRPEAEGALGQADISEELRNAILSGR